jgi:uncharacterized membrane protein
MQTDSSQKCKLCNQLDSLDKTESYCSHCLKTLEKKSVEKEEPVKFNIRLWNLIRSLSIFVAKLVGFTIILADVIMALATIIYAIDDNKIWLFIFWICLAILTFQFLRILESIQSRERKSPTQNFFKLLITTLVGAITGALIWPAFDESFGKLIGVAYGSLLGLTLELVFAIITAPPQSKNP